MKHLVLLDSQKQEYFKVADGIKTMFAYSTSSSKPRYDKIKIGDELYFIETSSKAIVKARCKVLDKLVCFDKEETKIILNSYINELQINKNDIKKLLSKPFCYIFEISDFELIKPMMYLGFIKSKDKTGFKDVLSFKDFSDDFVLVERTRVSNEEFVRYFLNKKEERMKKRQEKIDEKNQKILEQLFPYEESYANSYEENSEEIIDENGEEIIEDNETSDYFNMLEEKLANMNLSLEDLENMNLDDLNLEELSLKENLENELSSKENLETESKNEDDFKYMG